ncbi:MAG TPA: hypothetical protein VER79_01035 [Candidatus Limnocylindrales bacterium]|nr:hypothetical protein [Candidatus Limnocylindrales bacterium]
MGRVINTDGAGQQRSYYMRTAAELLRRLSQKETLDTDAKDMLAKLVFCFRDIEAGIDQSATAWEKRDYYLKADELRRRWDWTSPAASELEAVLAEERWNDVPAMMAKLFPHFSDVTVTKFMRKEKEWAGAYPRLMAEHSIRR